MSIDLLNRTVLLVDDEQFSRQTIAGMLTRLGNPNIHQLEDGQQALHFLRNSKLEISIVIADYKMPNLDGLQLLKKIRIGDAGVRRSMPFALVTGHSDKSVVDGALSLHVNAFLIKPVSTKNLTTRLQSALEAQDDPSWLSPAETYERALGSKRENPKSGKNPDSASSDKRSRPVGSTEKSGLQKTNKSRAQTRSRLSGRFSETDLRRTTKTRG